MTNCRLNGRPWRHHAACSIICLCLFYHAAIGWRHKEPLFVTSANGWRHMTFSSEKLLQNFKNSQKKSFNKILHTSRRLVSFTMMFSKETLSSFTNQYIAARKGNSCVPVFASSAALPETLKEPIVLFLRQYYCTTWTVFVSCTIALH